MHSYSTKAMFSATIYELNTRRPARI